jgi:hypothetical protein
VPPPGHDAGSGNGTGIGGGGAVGAGDVERPATGDPADTGHPAVDAVVRALVNAARLAPAEQLAEYEAAHRVLQETLSSIDG